MRALVTPIKHAGAYLRPEKPEPKSMKRFVQSYVTGSRCSVIGQKDITAKKFGDHNQHQTLFFTRKVQVQDQPTVNTHD
jgi:hypothetical protein